MRDLTVALLAMGLLCCSAEPEVRWVGTRGQVWRHPPRQVFLSIPRGKPELRWSEFNAVVLEALKAWGVSMRVGVAANGGLAEDGQCTLNWRFPSARTRLGISDETFGETRLYEASARGEAEGHVVEGDVVLFTDGIDWGTAEERTQRLSLVAHELGHLFGLSHNCTAAADGSPVPRCNHSTHLRQAMFPDARLRAAWLPRHILVGLTPPGGRRPFGDGREVPTALHPLRPC